MIDTNNIKCTLEDAWKEFERTGEITNLSEGVLRSMESLLKENENLRIDLGSVLKEAESLMFFREGTSYYKESEVLINLLKNKYKNQGLLQTKE